MGVIQAWLCVASSIARRSRSRRRCVSWHWQMAFARRDDWQALVAGDVSLIEVLVVEAIGRWRLATPEAVALREP